jgi:PKD repeat protein
VTTLVVAALIAGLGLAGARSAFAFSPAARTPLPTDRLHFGLQSDEASQLTWLKATNVPVKYRYQYLVDGVNTGGGSTDPNCGANAGWQTWASPAGAFVTSYINDTVPTRIPVFTYYQLVPSNPAPASDATADELTKISTLCTMQAYWADFTVMLQKVGAYGGQVVIHVEPDFWGNMEAAGPGVTNIPAAVASTGNVDLSGLPNTLQGMAWAYLKLRDKYAPNALLAIHVNNWQGGADLSTDQTASLSNARTQADTVAAFLKPAGFVGNPTGVSTWDLVFNDVADHDAASYNPISDPHWWDKNNVLFPNFARWLAFMSQLHTDLGVPLVEWQVPVGNQYFLSENNTPGHYQDNRVEYFLAHPADLMAAGIVAVLIGKANSGQTNYVDDIGDGITNPAAVVSWQCNLCNNHTSAYPDDDGGYLRIFLTAYYNGSPPSPSPSPIPSPSPSPSPSPPPTGGVPVYDHIVTIMMENTSYSSIIGNSAAPYINSLAGTGAVAGNYFATDHPSLPNYAELTSGQSFPNASSDCDPSSSCQSTALNISDRITASGRTWKEYAESMGSACNKTSSGQYAAKHNPFIYYTDISAASCQANVVDYSHLSGDLSSTATTPNYAFVTPNLCNDMHDCSVSTGDTWLSQNVPTILASPAFTQQHSLLVIVWDEDDFSGANQVAWIGVGYGLKTNYVSSVQYDHYSFLKTIETSWGLSTMTANDAAAVPMTDLFGSGSAPLSSSSSASRTAVTAPGAVSFTGTASGGTAPYGYAWTFGDGSSSTSQNPSHTYATAGTDSVNLTVTDAAAHTASASALSITVSPPLSVSDSASASSGSAPLAVNFTSTPSGGLPPYITYAWTFGDGGSAAVQNPSHTYTTAGIYSANLTVTDANGGTASASPLGISVHGPLSATASASRMAGDAPVAVGFTGSGAGGTTPYSYSWAFGDGASSNLQNPSHTYTGPGTFTATLTITDSSAGTAVATAVVVVSPSLGASASASVSQGPAPLAVTFTGTTSGGLGPFTYAWNFGDGVSSTIQNPSHTYAVAGNYTATLAVTDANRVLANATQLTITVTPILAVSTSALPGAGDAPLTVAFTGTPSGGTAPYSYAWTFGDGSTSTSPSPSHTYSSAGSFNATLTVTDAIGVMATAPTLNISVNPQPSAVSAANRTAGDVPVTVAFTGSVSGGTAPYTYAWSFGDGTSAASQNPSHTYTTAGKFSVVLTVTDGAAHTATASTLTLTVSPSLIVSAGASPISGNAPLAASFTGTPSGGLLPYTYAWSFGDGGTASVQNPSHIYTAAGDYPVNLIVTDANGATAAASGFSITVHGPLSAAASASPSAGDAPVTVTFAAGGTGGTVPYSFSWTFGDGGTASVQNPSHIYTSGGTYNATVTITDANGNTATASAVVTVSPSLVANSSATPTSGAAPLALAFNGSAIGGLAPFNYAWSFGDGASSASQNPSHTYAIAGTYTVTLSITDANRVLANATALTIVVTPGLGIAPSVSPTAGDAPLTVVFTAGASGGTSPYAYAWTFGDGGSSTLQNPSHTYTSAGTYTASLTVRDAMTVSASGGLTVGVNPPLAATAIANRSAGDAPLAVGFGGAASGGTPSYTFAWTFGDGGTSNAQKPSHSYTTAGTYSVNLMVTDSVARTATATVLTITISPSLIVSAGASPISGNAPLAASFSGTPSGGLLPYTYAWSFGDGATSNVQNPAHTYSAAGSYSAGLIVTDANGVQAASTTLSIVAIGPLSAAAMAAPAAGDAPFTTTLTGSATGGQATYSYAWDFGDGGTSTVQIPSHLYSIAGLYAATLTVRDGSGKVSQAVVHINVYPALSVSAAATPTVGVAPLQVTFTASGSGGLAPYTFAWNYADGATASGSSVAHSYAAGTFLPTLTVRDAAGGIWRGGAGTISATNPPNPTDPGETAPPSPPGEVATSPEPSPSPSGDRAAPSAAPAAAGDPQRQVSGPTAPGDIGLILMLLALVLGTLLGGALIFRFVRHRA